MTKSKPAELPPLEVDQIDMASHLVREIARSILAATDDNVAEREQRTRAAVNIVKSLAPGDVLETQLIVQMVMGHMVATEAIRRASRPGEHPQTLSLHLRDASRFMSLYREQVRTLTHYRGTPRERQRDARRANREDLGKELSELQPLIKQLCGR